MRHNEGHDGRGHHRRGGKRPFDNGVLRILILDLIASGTAHGYGIITALEERSAGTYRPSPGVIYPNLTWLEDNNLITCTGTSGRSKDWAVTDKGLDFLRLNRDTLDDLAKKAQHRGKGRWGGQAPDAVFAAMDGLKAALRSRLEYGASEAAISAATAAINTATQTILAGLPETHPQAQEPHMTQVITRHRHEIRRRVLTVADKQYLTPQMIRITLKSPDLADFVSLGADDHVKLFFPLPDGTQTMRDYTPRAYDNDAGTLVIDFAVHEAGPATQWAIDATVGTELNIGGPRGSAVISPVFDWYLLIGDETALPAIGRRIEELPAGVTTVSVVTITDDAEQQTFDTKATHIAHWINRPASDAANPEALIAALRGLDLPAGKGFVWIGTESTVARAARDHIQNERGHPKEWLKASGYWIKGVADAKDKLD